MEKLSFVMNKASNYGFEELPNQFPFTFVQWCEQQPLLSLESWRHRQQPGDEPVSYTQILEAMIQTKCQHKETHRKGSNAYLTKVTRRTCNKVIKSEKIGKKEEGNKSTSSSSAPPSRQGIPSPATPQTTSDGTDLEHLTDYIRNFKNTFVGKTNDNLRNGRSSETGYPEAGTEASSCHQEGNGFLARASIAAG